MDGAAGRQTFLPSFSFIVTFARFVAAAAENSFKWRVGHPTSSSTLSRRKSKSDVKQKSNPKYISHPFPHIHNDDGVYEDPPSARTGSSRLPPGAAGCSIATTARVKERWRRRRMWKIKLRNKYYGRGGGEKAKTVKRRLSKKATTVQRAEIDIDDGTGTSNVPRPSVVSQVLHGINMTMEMEEVDSEGKTEREAGTGKSPKANSLLPPRSVSPPALPQNSKQVLRQIRVVIPLRFKV
ncbi:hypothetical protein F5876DRAFT_63653 [Lentinula aff. lateritia]|uniref:Uncharacterized protein n=1 Tax=Lentinula aff. lateritia TaxID=2804960 RepID=A0ACC1U7C4_9AGAR|nr:hypothetical protein F5876DRAFT_63653 [Lentinula aff. lateritia]